MARRGPITMRLDDRAVLRRLRSGDKPARQAMVDSINRAVRSELKVMYRRAATDLKMPQKIVRKRTYNSPARQNRPSYVVRTVTMPVNAALLKPKASRRVGGLITTPRTGSRKFPGAFLALSPMSRTRAYKRKGSARKPIELVNIDIHEIVARSLKRMNRKALKVAVRRHYPKQLKFRRSKLGRSRTR